MATRCVSDSSTTPQAGTNSRVFSRVIAPTFITGLVVGLFVSAGLLPFGQQYLTCALSSSGSSQVAVRPAAGQAPIVNTDTTSATEGVHAAVSSRE